MRYILSIFLALVLLGCKQDTTPTYPHCFENLESTHSVYATCGAFHVYVSLTDTSGVFFRMHDDELDIGTACKTFTPQELIDWNNVQYYEWTSHPDSLAPNFCDDIAYMETSTIHRWDLTSGEVTAVVSKESEKRVANEIYQVSIQLSNGFFDRSSSNLPNITVDNMIVKDVMVGWFL